LPERRVLQLAVFSDQDRVVLLDRFEQVSRRAFVAVPHSRMLESRFAYFRGTAILQANDLRGTMPGNLRQDDCHVVLAAAIQSEFDECVARGLGRQRTANHFSYVWMRDMRR
jgi:hypothetical protein